MNDSDRKGGRFVLEEWKYTDTTLALDLQALHVYWIDMQGGDSILAECSSLLSGEELLRAERRIAGPVRSQFVLAKAALRVILGRLTGTMPLDIRFKEGPHGKPELAVGLGPRFSFNTAHSLDTVLVAVRRSGAIGVDVERIDSSVDALGISERYFTANEFAYLKSLADHEQCQRAFYEYWVQKEAVVKADGRGLSLGLDSFDVPNLPAGRRGSTRIVAADGERSVAYQIAMLPIGENTVAAVATDQFDMPMKLLKVSLRCLLDSTLEGTM